MEQALTAIFTYITTKGEDGILMLGWLLYLLERYYFSPRREREFRDDLTAVRADYQSLADKLTVTLSGFSTILEIVKDRIGRAK